MEYHVRALWQINEGAKGARRSFKTEKLEQALTSTLPANVSVTLVECDLTAILSIPLNAEVLRNLNPREPHQEVVRLSSNGKYVDLVRGKDIDVSCNSEGDRVPVRTINIKFRDINDNLTDRGVVWVFPGNPASIHLTINQEALKTPGKTTEIVRAAEEAVRDKVLAHFT